MIAIKKAGVRNDFVMNVLGRNPTGERLKRVQSSPNYRNGAFQNPEPTEVILPDSSFPKIMMEFLQRPSSIMPPKPLPSLRTDLSKIEDNRPVITWFGHSSYLIQHLGFSILVDPVFTGYASPVPLFARAFKGSDIYTVKDMPSIDLLLLTHDHYDHLDYNVFLQLKDKVKRVVTSLGVGGHLEYWGMKPELLTELDWWEAAAIAQGIRLIAVPARHFSGRMIKRGQTLWSAFVLEMHGYRLFLGGDSGYGKHFKEIATKYPGFDIALLEGGQYGKHWPYIHMHPMETVQAAQDLKAKILLPVHWGKFALSVHPWNEPVRIVHQTAAKHGLQVVSPRIGEPYALGQEWKQEAWWEM